MAELVSVTLEKRGGFSYYQEAIESIEWKMPEAIVIRTYQTNRLKSRKYSHTNPPYLEEAARAFIRKRNPTFIN
jgi:hypothetical protein